MSQATGSAAGELDGRVVLVTGASRGLGHAVARATAAAGAIVLLAARDVAALEALADDIEQAGGAAPLIVPLNLEGAGAADYASVAEHVAERCGGLDGLVLNAAMLGELAPLASADPVRWARVFQVNLHANFLLLQATLPLLEASADGAVVFTLDALGERARAHWGAYAASKAALRALMETLADEHERRGRPRVHGVDPGPLATRLRAAAYPGEERDAQPAPATVAPVFVELLGPRGQARHGEVLHARQD